MSGSMAPNELKFGQHQNFSRSNQFKKMTRHAAPFKTTVFNIIRGSWTKKYGKENDEKVNTSNNPMDTEYKNVIKNANLSLKTRMKASLLEKIIHQV